MSPGIRLPLARIVGSASFPQLAAVDEGLQDVLLSVVIVVDDIGHPLAELRQVLYTLVDSVVSHVIGGRLGSQQPVVTDILFGKTVSIVTTNDRVGKIEVLDDGLQLALIFLRHLPAEDHGDLLRLADGPIPIQQALSEFVHSGASEKDQIVTVLYLREEQAVMTAGLSWFLGGEEGSERRQPLVPALQEISRLQGIGQLLQSLRM